MTEPTLAAGLFRMLLGAGVAAGVPRRALLDAAGLTEAELIDPDASLPLTAQLAVGRAVLAARPGINLGLVALKHSGPGTLGVLGYAIAHCPRLRDALGLFIRHQGLVTDAARWRLVGGRLHVGAHPALAALGHPIEHMIGLWVVLGRHLTGQAWVPRAVHFTHAPLGDPAEHAALFGVAPRFEADETLLDLGDALDLPVLGARVDLQPGLVALLEARTPEGDGIGETALAVESTLRDLLPRGVADKDAVARSLGVSARTLARRLKAEGTTFQQALDDVRAQLARYWLAEGSLAIYEVAFMLGYSETSAFHRAFRRWTGEAPAAWRADADEG